MQEEIDAAVKALLDLKAEYKKVTGTDFPVAKPARNQEKSKPANQEKAKPAKPPKKEKTPPAADSKQTEVNINRIFTPNLFFVHFNAKISGSEE